MLVEKEDITTYIPQRFPFVMIDNLIVAEEEKFESDFEIKEDNIFLKDGTLSESALIENIAQTCAAGFGYIGSQKGEDAGKLGFIGSVSRLVVYDSAKINQVINAKIEVISTFDTIHLIEGCAYHNGKELVKCQMKIVVG